MRHYKFSLLLLLLLTAAPALRAQVSMRSVFTSMPDSLLPYLTENNRLDMVDFIDSKMKAEVTNQLGGKSLLLKLTDNYLSLALTEASTLDMRLFDVAPLAADGQPLPSADGQLSSAGGQLQQVLCVVRTYGSDIRESVVSFFTPDWQPLPADRFMAQPSDMFMAVLSDAEPTLTIVPECRLDYPANEDQEVLTKPSTILKWDGRKLK